MSCLTACGTTVKDAAESAVAAVEEAKDTAKEAVSNAAETVKDKAEEVKDKAEEVKETTANAVENAVNTVTGKEEESLPDLTGQTLMIYCGAGMKQPFTKIAEAFQEATGCEVNVTYANAAQIQTQITTAQEGAFFIAGAAGEVKPVADYVISSVNLVKHIPVLAVAAGNPKGITGIADLGNADISTVIGDPESTPIGKIAMQAFQDFNVADSVTLVATTTTAPQLATVITLGEADAAIVWKENCNEDGVEVCDTPDMDAYVKTIPAARLSFSEDDAAADAFGAFLETDAANAIWTSFGYELVK
ncbi:MAG: molybdate ABC transporter substrate-binding protein [Oscillospiraceae bacterium]|nr:molybdate ABC transporter substrate-binding protein [Oscillospiraceae bacterium]